MAGRVAASADVPAPAAAAGAGIVAEGPPAVEAAGATIGASWAAPRARDPLDMPGENRRRFSPNDSTSGMGATSGVGL